MRTDYCRQHIDQTAKECGIEKTAVTEVKQALTYAEQYPALADCSTYAINTLMRVKDDEVQETARRLVVAALDRSNPNGGERKESFTGAQIREFIKNAELEVSTRREREQKKEVEEAEVAIETVKTKILVSEESVKPVDAAELDRLSEVLKDINSRIEQNTAILKTVDEKLEALEETVAVQRAELRETEGRIRNVRGYREAVRNSIRLAGELTVHVARQIKAIREGRDPRTKEERAWLKRHEAEEAKHAEVLKQMYELMIRGI